MKKNLLTAAAVASALVISLSIASCSGEKTPDPSGTEPSSTPVSDPVSTGNNTEAETSSAAESDNTEAASTENTGNAQADSSVYNCVLSDSEIISIGAPVGDTIKALDEKYGQTDYMEAVSCVHEGFDKVYTFTGFTVSTSPAADGSEYITELSLLSDEVQLENGIMIGSTSDEVTSAFGRDFTEKFGVRVYELSGVKLSIIFTDDLVSALSFSKPIE